MRRRALSGAIGAFIFLQLPHWPHAAAADEAIPLDVRFVGGVVSENFGEVVVELARAGFIQTALVPVNKPTIRDQLFQGMPIPGNSISEDLEAYLCELNPHVCSPVKKGLFKWTDQFATAVPSAPLPCPTDLADKSRRPDEVCMPLVAVSKYPASILVQFNGQKESLARKVTEIGACPAFDAECVDSIVRLNPGLKPAATEKGGIIGLPLRLPTTAYRLRVNAVDAAVAKQISNMIQALAVSREAAGKFDSLNPNIYVTPGGADPEPIQPQGEDVPMTASIPPLKMSGQALQAMNYPWAVPDTQSSLQAYYPVTVGIWDILFDPQQCDFGQPPNPAAPGTQILRYDPMPTYPQRSVQREKCGAIAEATLDDHGTYVAGVVAGLGHDELGLGVNPKASLWEYEVRADKLAQDNDPIDAAWRGLNGTVAQARIINFSNTSPQVDYHLLLQSILMGPPGFSRQRGGWLNQVLVVAAAGQAGRTYASEAGCEVYPACWSSDENGGSIISVIALNLAGNELAECPVGDGNSVTTNIGEAFDVAAVGIGFSSLIGDKFGEMCGTSVAAPYVSGLASLLLAKSPFGPNMTPINIKQRILTTADMPGFLKGRVRYGRINFKRALQYEDDLLFVDANDCDAPPCTVQIGGSVAKVGRELAINEAWERNRKRNGPLDITRILRIVREADNSRRYRVIYLGDDGNMEILYNVLFDPSAKLDVYKTGKSAAVDQVVNLENVADFTPCSIACTVSR